MTGWQKVVKYCAIVLAVILSVSIIGSIVKVVRIVGTLLPSEQILGEMQTYEIPETVHSMEIEAGIVEFSVTEGESFLVESNLKDLTVEVKEDVLIIREKDHMGITYKETPTLRIIVPEGYVPDMIDAEVGVGVIELTGRFSQLLLDVGTGDIKVNNQIPGDCRVHVGIGAIEMVLAGNTDLYTISLEKGIGSTSLDGETVKNDTVIGRGENNVEIEGGIGDISVRFEESEEMP